MNATNSLAVSTLATSLAAATATPALAAESHWQIDPAHVTAQFSVRHMMVSTVRGQFANVSGEVVLDEQDTTRSKINIHIDARSIDTRVQKRDDHLRSADFFDVEKTPDITFRSTRIEKAGKDRYKVTGDLTMHGVTKPATLVVNGPTAPIKNPWGGTVRGVSATGKINRKEWGLNWNSVIEAGGLLVGDEIEIAFDAELNPAETKTASK